METSPNDSDQFLADIAAIRVKAAGRDSFLLRLGALMMPAGIVLGIVGYALSHNTDNPLDQRDAMIIALIGISVTLTGVALFVRYSLAEFLRFWMARLIHQQAQLAGGAGPAAAPPSATSSAVGASSTATTSEA